MESKLDIYPSVKNEFNNANKKLETISSERNKELIISFQNYQFSKGCKEKRVAKLTRQLIKILPLINCELDKATKQDILNVVSHINRREDYSEATKSDYRRLLKQFYGWFKDEDERLESNDYTTRTIAKRMYNYIEKEVKRSFKTPEIDPTTILTEEDVDKVVRGGCKTIKEKAFIKFLHETGVRSGEMLGLRLKDIEVRKNLGVAYVNGKTGRRKVEFVKSMAYVVQWLDCHPFKEDKNYYVWLGESTNKMHRPLIHVGAYKMVDRCFKRASVNKRHNLHWFRHSRASLNAPFWTESIMCKYFGWVSGSKQVRTYVHLCQKDVENAFMKMNGLVEQEEKKNEVQTCGCGAIYDSFAKYCLQCGNPLSVAVALQDQELVKYETDKSIKLLMEIAKNPELMRKFEEFKSQSFAQKP